MKLLVLWEWIGARVVDWKAGWNTVAYSSVLVAGAEAACDTGRETALVDNMTESEAALVDDMTESEIVLVDDIESEAVLVDNIESEAAPVDDATELQAA